jgi:hypothetical protein
MRNVILLIIVVPLGGCIYYNYSQPYPDTHTITHRLGHLRVTTTTSRTLLRRALEQMALSISIRRNAAQTETDLLAVGTLDSGCAGLPASDFRCDHEDSVFLGDLGHGVGDG